MDTRRALIPSVVALLGGLATVPWVAAATRSDRSTAPRDAASVVDRERPMRWVGVPLQPLAAAATASRRASPEPIATIAGTVVDAQGEPVDGAALSLLRLPELWERELLDDALVDSHDLPAPSLAATGADAVTLARTAADGTFALPLDAPFVGVVVASSDGRTHAVSDLVFADEDTTSTVTIVARPAGTAFGVITEEDGSPARSCQLALAVDDVWILAPTDADGVFRVEDLPFARWTLEGEINRFLETDPMPIQLDREVRAGLTHGSRVIVQACWMPDVSQLGEVVLTRDGDDGESYTGVVVYVDGCWTQQFDDLRPGDYDVWLVRDRDVGNLGRVAAYGSGDTRFDASPPASTEPLDSQRGRQLRAVIEGGPAEAKCIPQLDTVRLHGRVVVARGGPGLDEGAVLVAIDGHRVGHAPPERMPNWSLRCADDVGEADATLLVQYRGEPIRAVTVPGREE